MIVVICLNEDLIFYLAIGHLDMYPNQKLSYHLAWLWIKLMSCNLIYSGFFPNDSMKWVNDQAFDQTLQKLWESFR